MKIQSTLSKALLVLVAAAGISHAANAQPVGGLDGGVAVPIGGDKLKLAPPKFNINPNRPRLVVLLHGVTPKPEEAPEQHIGFPDHGRHYWGWNFIKAIQGEAGVDKGRMITPKINGKLQFMDYNRSLWQSEFSYGKVWDRASVVFPVSWNTVLPSDINTNEATMKTFVRLMCQEKRNPETMVMINTRNGSNHLMPQVSETIEEIYATYMATFGHLKQKDQPQIYLVGHSFGGIIARAILANPKDADLWGNKLSALNRQKADFLRERVVLVKTLSSPHEPTHIGDPASDVADFISEHGVKLVTDILQEVQDWGFGDEQTAEEIRADAEEAVKVALDAVSGKRDCLEDLARMNEFNNGILRPSTARRSEGGELVPIYTAGGRNPGNLYFDDNRTVWPIGGVAGLTDFRPISVLDVLFGGRRPREAAALNIIEGIMHAEGYGKEGKKPWGTATSWHGDRVASPWAGFGSPKARPVDMGWYPNIDRLLEVMERVLDGREYVYGRGDGEWDNDGFLGWDAAMGWNLQAENFYRVYDPQMYGDLLPWDIDNHGSLMFNTANGQWIYNELIQKAGPLVGPMSKGRSLWSPHENPTHSVAGIRLEVLEVLDTKDEIDPVGEADFDLYVRLGANEEYRMLPDDTNHVKDINIPPFEITNYKSSLIPIRIRVVDRDNGEDDLCYVSENVSQTSMYGFFDTRTNTFLCDDNEVVYGPDYLFGENAQVVTTNPYAPLEGGNAVQLKFKITRIQ